jgi:molybdopterin molybdotransferase
MKTANTPQFRPPGVDEVLAILRIACLQLGTETLPLGQALGRILREDVCATEDQPAVDRSAVDGFAIRLDETATTFRIVDAVRAGDWLPRKLQLGEAVQISTGGALPDTGLQVVMREDAQVEDGHCSLLNRSHQTNIRIRGEDTRAGTLLLPAGTLLTPGALALLATCGHTQPVVTRLPRVIHFATGDEIVPPESTPKHGQIRDTNSTLVGAFFRQFGIVPTQFRLPEDLASASDRLAELRSEIDRADVLIFSGGASVGVHDHTRSLLQSLGFALLINGTNLRPGKPFIFATNGPRLAFALPGNPLAHFVGLNMFVQLALALLCGAGETLSFKQARLIGSVDAGAESREILWPAHFSLKDGTAHLSLLDWKSSGDLTVLAHANALACVPARTGHVEPGTLLNFLLLPSHS